MAEKMTLEENQEFADDVLKPVVAILDDASGKYDIEKLKETLKAMEDQQSTMAAWPLPESMAKAKVMKVQNELFESIINMLELRIEIKNQVIQNAQEKTHYNDLLKNLGI